MTSTPIITSQVSESHSSCVWPWLWCRRPASWEFNLLWGSAVRLQWSPEPDPLCGQPSAARVSSFPKCCKGNPAFIFCLEFSTNYRKSDSSVFGEWIGDTLHKPPIPWLFWLLFLFMPLPGQRYSSRVSPSIGVLTRLTLVDILQLHCCSPPETPHTIPTASVESTCHWPGSVLSRSVVPDSFWPHGL